MAPWPSHCLSLLSLIWLGSWSNGPSTRVIAEVQRRGLQKYQSPVSKCHGAFIGNVLLPAESRRNGRSDGNALMKGAGNGFQNHLEASKKAIGRAVGVCRELRIHANSLSTTINEHIEPLRQKIRQSTLFKTVGNALDAVKRRVMSLSTSEQIALAMLGKYIYAFVLPGYHLLFPFQLVPVNSGLGLDIGLDTIFAAGAYCVLASSLQSPTTQPALDARTKLSIPFVAAGLLGSFYLSGYAAHLVDNIMLLLSAVGAPVSVGLQQSVRILLSHLSWVLIGAKMLNYVLPLASSDSEWFKMDAKGLWVHKALAGYFVSCTLYNFADVLFIALEKLKRAYHTDEIEVGEELLDNPLMEQTEIIPTIIAAIGPCITAPWWEEMLYRVFVFKSLHTKMPRSLATAISALIFSVHHMNPRSVIQLFALGVLWSIIEQGTNNLFVSIAIHSMWNTRIMIGTLLGR